MPFTDEFISSDQLGTEFLSDIDIAVCKQCACAQNINDTDMGAYYQDYTYSVQSSGFALSCFILSVQSIPRLSHNLATVSYALTM